MRRRLALLGAVLALVGVAAGCGGDDEPDSTAAWASSFCGAVTSWTEEIESVLSQFSDTSNLSEDGIQSAADDARSSTEDLVDEIRGLGRPPTESGDEVESAVGDLSNTLEDETAEIEQTVDGIDSLTELPSALVAIQASMAALGSSLSNALTTIQEADAGGELRAAFEDSPECAGIS